MTCRTVLVVDEDQGTRALCTSVLRESGYFVIEAHDGISGWHQVSRYPPDLITMGQPASVYGGRTLLDSIRANPGMERVKFVFVSNPGASSEHLLSDEGLEPHLSKPIEPRQYLELVMHLIGPPIPESGGENKPVPPME